MTPLILLVATLGLATGLLIAAFWLVKKRFGYASYASGIATVVLGLPLVIAATALALLTDTSTIFGPSIARPDLKVVDLNPLYRPTDVTGDWSVGIISKGFRPEVYLANVRTGDVRQLTDDGHQKYEAVVSGDIVAWIDQERGDEVVALDMSTGEERRIANSLLHGPSLTYKVNALGRRYGLRIAGNRLVWTEFRGDQDFDIYAYDLETDEQIAVAVAPGRQWLGANDGDRIVWSDSRGGAYRGTNPFGCPHCPDTRSGIYLFDFTAGERLLVADEDMSLARTDIHDRWVVWRDNDHEGREAIRLYDLDTCATRTLATSGRFLIDGPLVSGNYVVWTVGWDCDVEPWPTDVQYGAFAYDLRTGEVIQLSDYIEPSIAVDGDVAVIAEHCLGSGPTYAVFLPE